MENEVFEEAELDEFWHFFDDPEIRKTTYVYKKNEDGHSPQIDKYCGEVPDPHDVGLKHGAGEYKFIISYTDKTGERKTTTKRKELGLQYNEYKEQRAGELSSQLSEQLEHDKKMSGSASPTEWVDAIMDALERVVPLFAPLVLNGKSTDPFDEEIQRMKKYTTDSMLDSIKITKNTVQEIQKESVRNFNEALSTIAGNALNSYGDSHDVYYEEEEEEMSIVKIAWGMIQPQIENIVNGLLDDKLEEIKSNALFQQIVNNPQALSQLQQLILKHTNVNTLQKISEKLGL